MGIPIAESAILGKRCGEASDEFRLLFRLNRAQVEDELIFFDTSDHRNGRDRFARTGYLQLGSSQVFFQLFRAEAWADDRDERRWQMLIGRRATADDGNPIAYLNVNVAYQQAFQFLGEQFGSSLNLACG